jgi:hypothetical protein
MTYKPLNNETLGRLERYLREGSLVHLDNDDVFEIIEQARRANELESASYDCLRKPVDSDDAENQAYRLNRMVAYYNGDIDEL